MNSQTEKGERNMSLLKRIFKGFKGHYAYDENYLTQLIEEEKKHGYMKNLIEISDKIIEENPNFIDEVKKSETGCWMEQVYGTRYCNICDFVDDCPIKLEADFQAYLQTLSEEARTEVLALIAHKEAVMKSAQSIKQSKQG
jgi:hypothetical protein